MRQPVATIIALAEAALSNDEIPLGVRRRLGQVMNQAEWLGEMLRHLIEPAANGAVNGAAEGEFLDLVRLARDVVQIEMATYPGDLALQWDGGNMCVAGNGVELRRAITNLLRNATRAAGPEGKVAVQVRRAAGRVLLDRQRLRARVRADSAGRRPWIAGSGSRPGELRREPRIRPEQNYGRSPGRSSR